jgi:hypothetical protein
MNADTKRRMRGLAKDLRIERRIWLDHDQTAYELVVYNAPRRQCEVEIWRSMGHRAWERIDRFPLDGKPERHNVLRQAKERL